MRRRFRSIMLVLAVTALAGCSDTIVMQNPQTKETMSCKVVGVTQSLAKLATEFCAKSYEKVGWVRAGS